MIPEDADAAPCVICDKAVLLHHDPPAQCGTVTCPDCPPHECEECADV